MDAKQAMVVMGLLKVKEKNEKNEKKEKGKRGNGLKKRKNKGKEEK
jgi:hypothetical protein